MNIPTSTTKQVLTSVKTVLTSTILYVNIYTLTKIIFQIMVTLNY